MPGAGGPGGPGAQRRIPPWGSRRGPVRGRLPAMDVPWPAASRFVHSRRLALPLGLLLALPAPAREPAPELPDTPAMRVRADEALRALNADLLGHDSATLTLERWCAAHRIAPATVTATLVRGAARPLPADLREKLGVGPGEPVAYRRVLLACGGHVLSEADNWYLPRRLTPEMNAVLEHSDVPFGKVVRPLDFHRTTLSTRWLWSPLRAEATPARDAHPGRLAVPHRLLQHRAMLSAGDGRPFSVLVETYTDQVLAGLADGH